MNKEGPKLEIKYSCEGYCYYKRATDNDAFLPGVYFCDKLKRGFESDAIHPHPYCPFKIINAEDFHKSELKRLSQMIYLD